jgi:hypothetical protein
LIPAGSFVFIILKIDRPRLWLVRETDGDGSRRYGWRRYRLGHRLRLLKFRGGAGDRDVAAVEMRMAEDGLVQDRALRAARP